MPPRPSSSSISYPGTTGQSADTSPASSGESVVAGSLDIGCSPLRRLANVTTATKLYRARPENGKESRGAVENQYTLRHVHAKVHGSFPLESGAATAHPGRAQEVFSASYWCHFALLIARSSQANTHIESSRSSVTTCPKKVRRPSPKLSSTSMVIESRHVMDID